MKRYATFWRRVGARLIDALVLSPLSIPSLYLVARGVSYRVYLLYTVLSVLLGAAYFIGMHYHRGQTLGKMATVVRVIRIDEQPLTLGDAIVRYLPFLFIGLIFIVPVFWLLREEETINLQALIQCANPAAVWINFAWTVAQIIVVANSDRRRAIHDYLAETQVVVVDRT